jgi:anti-anti-sigma factor
VEDIMVEHIQADAPSSNARAFYGHGDHTAVVELRGELRYATANALRSFADDLIATEKVDVVLVDLSQATFIDSTGLGLIARIGRRALSRSGRRAIIVCPDGDVASTLRSAALDELFVMVEEPPFDWQPRLEEVTLAAPQTEDSTSLGRMILEAHRDLAGLSARNREEYRDVIAALEAELRRPPRPPHP